MGKKKKYQYWNVPVTYRLNGELNDLILNGYFVSKSEAIRCAVRLLIDYLKSEALKE